VRRLRLTAARAGVTHIANARIGTQPAVEQRLQLVAVARLDSLGSIDLNAQILPGADLRPPS